MECSHEEHEGLGVVTPSHLGGHEIDLDHDLGIVLRDGVVTRADLWISRSRERVPTILVRTPYGKETHFHMSPVDPRTAIARGYAMVIQDVRGRGTSSGHFVPFDQERADGQDTIAWIAEQPWSDGRVVMTGPSYVGVTQWLAASTHPPALKAIAPLNSTPLLGEGFIHTNSVRENGFITAWVCSSLGPTALQRPDDIDEADADPLTLAELVPQVKKWFESPSDSPYWSELDVDATEIDIPVLTVGGWYDIFIRGSIEGFTRRGDPRDRMVIGAWGHDNYFSHLVGPRSQGASGSGAGLSEVLLDFFDAALAGVPAPMPVVRVYDSAARRWQDFAQWPPRETSNVRWSLNPGVITVDPRDLPPSAGGRWLRVGEPGGNWGPVDQRTLAAREDVTSTEITLRERLVLAGPGSVTIDFETDSDDERLWTVVLCQRHPDSSLDVLTEGVARISAAHGSAVIPLGDLFLTLEAGSRLELLIGGGLFPRWDPTTAGGEQRILASSVLNLTTHPSIDNTTKEEE